LVGTFVLVFAGCGAVMVDAKTGALGHVGVAITFGLVIMAMIYAVGHVSGGDGYAGSRRSCGDRDRRDGRPRRDVRRPDLGGAMNPARSIGPALVSGDLCALWIYIAAPLWEQRPEH
jgi:glycerol uptake facilitator-like aquaporin